MRLVSIKRYHTPLFTSLNGISNTWLVMASSLFTGLDGQPISDGGTLGYGRLGVVIRRGHLAIEIPLRHPWSSGADVQSNIETVQREQEVYHRFRSFDRDQIGGVVPCIELYKYHSACIYGKR